MRVTVLRKLIPVKCFCVTLFIIGFLYQIESLPGYRATAQDNQPANAQSNQPGNSPAVEKPLTADDASSRSNKTEAATDKIKKAEWVQIGINAFILLVIFWQAWTYHQQRKLMQRQLRALYASDRAYVGIAQMNLLVSGGAATLEITWINGGKTPAWHFRAMPLLVLGENLEIHKMQPVFDDFDTDVSGSFLSAGAERTISYPQRSVRIVGTTWDDLKNRKKQLYAIGSARYVDFRGEEQACEIEALYDVRGIMDQSRNRFVETYRFANQPSATDQQAGPD